MARTLFRRFGLFTVALAGLGCLLGPSASRAAADQNPLVQQGDPWNANDLIDPATLARTLASGSSEKPVVLCVGVAALYRGAHIIGAKYAGPGSSADGLKLLDNVVHDLSPDQPLVIYCGCCPWQHCPNIRPAFAHLRKLGFKYVRVLTIPSNFHDDWVKAGLPVEKGAASS